MHEKTEGGGVGGRRLLMERLGYEATHPKWIAGYAWLSGNAPKMDRCRVLVARLVAGFFKSKTEFHTHMKQPVKLL
jgi:hypothetical protein